MAKSNVLIKSKLKKARLFVAQNNLAEAKSLYTQLYLKNKGIHTIGLELAVVHRKLGEFKSTESISNNIIKTSPKNALAHHIHGSALQCLNQFDAAIKEYKFAITLDKNLVEAHYFLGNIHQLMGNLEFAAKAFYKTIELKPNFYEALNNLGAALIALNRPIDAKKIIDRALKIEPNSIQLLCNIAGFYMLENNPEKALEYAEKAYKANPEFIDTLKILGKIHYQNSEYNKSLDFYKKAYEISKDVKLTAYIAQILERRSEYTEANELINPLVDAGQTDIVTLMTYSALSRKFKNQQRAIDLLEKAVKKDSSDFTSLISLHSELGKHYDAFKDFDKAFTNYKKANLIERKLNKQFEDINEAKELNNINISDIKKWHKTYPASFWQGLPSSCNKSDRPIFVIGMFRSGTTLCEQILSSHPDVHGAGELPDINQLSYTIKPGETHDRSPASLQSATQGKLNELAESYLNTLNKKSTSSSFVVDKMPTNFMHVGLISKIFPNARIIHMIRDPRDTCLSMYFQRFGAQMTFTTDLTELADYHLSYQAFMKYWKEVLDIEIHDVVYENLIGDQENMTRKMLTFCGLEWNEQCMSFHKSKRDVNTPSYDQVRKPLYKKSVARWKNYKEYLKPLIDKLNIEQKLIHKNINYIND